MTQRRKFKYAEPPVFRYQTFDHNAFTFTDHPIIPVERLHFTDWNADNSFKPNESRSKLRVIELDPPLESAADANPADDDYMDGMYPSLSSLISVNTTPDIIILGDDAPAGDNEAHFEQADEVVDVGDPEPPAEASEEAADDKCDETEPVNEPESTADANPEEAPDDGSPSSGIPAEWHEEPAEASTEAGDKPANTPEAEEFATSTAEDIEPQKVAPNGDEPGSADAATVVEGDEVLQEVDAPTDQIIEVFDDGVLVVEGSSLGEEEGDQKLGATKTEDIAIAEEIPPTLEVDEASQGEVTAAEDLPATVEADSEAQSPNDDPEGPNDIVANQDSPASSPEEETSIEDSKAEESPQELTEPEKQEDFAAIEPLPNSSEEVTPIGDQEDGADAETSPTPEDNADSTKDASADPEALANTSVGDERVDEQKEGSGEHVGEGEPNTLTGKDDMPVLEGSSAEPPSEDASPINDDVQEEQASATKEDAPAEMETEAADAGTTEEAAGQERAPQDHDAEGEHAEEEKPVEDDIPAEDEKAAQDEQPAEDDGSRETTGGDEADAGAKDSDGQGEVGEETSKDAPSENKGPGEEGAAVDAGETNDAGEADTDSPPADATAEQPNTQEATAAADAEAVVAAGGDNEVSVATPSSPDTSKVRRKKKHRERAHKTLSSESDPSKAALNGHKTQLERRKDEKGLFMFQFGRAINKAYGAQAMRHETAEYKAKQEERRQRKEAREAKEREEQRRAREERRAKEEEEAAERRRKRREERARIAAEVEAAEKKRFRRPSFPESTSSGRGQRPGLLKRMTTGESDTGTGSLLLFNPNKGLSRQEVPRSHQESRRTHHKSGPTESQASGSHGSSRGSSGGKPPERPSTLRQRSSRSERDRDRFDEAPAIRLARAVRNILVN